MNDSQCCCYDQNETYRIIENYRSILNRKQSFISSWKIFDDNEKISFVQGRKTRKHSDALVIRSNYICLINPWYKYIDIKNYFSSIIKKTDVCRVFEIILIECNCLNSAHQYELGIIQCPCLEKLKTYCEYCQLTLTVTGYSSACTSNELLENKNPHINISFSLNCSNEKKDIIVLQSINEYDIDVTTSNKSINVDQSAFVYENVNNSSMINKATDHQQDTQIKQDFLKSNRKGYSPIRSVSFPFFPQQTESISPQIGIKSIDNKFTLSIHYRTRATQTKLYAILLPKSPLYIMNEAKIEARTLISATRTCQVNTLAYLIKISESEAEIQNSLEHILNEKQKVHLSPYSVFDKETTLMKDLLAKEEVINKQNEIHTNEQNRENFMSMPLPPKCINTCDVIDFDGINVPMTSFLNNDICTRSTEFTKKYHLLTPLLNSKHKNSRKQTHSKCSNVNNHNQNLSSYRFSKLFRLKQNRFRLQYRHRRPYHNKKRIYNFLQHFYYRRKVKQSHIHFFESQIPSCIISTDTQLDVNNILSITHSKTKKHDMSFNRQQQSVINLNLHDYDFRSEYKAYEHIFVARASKNSQACLQLQYLLNNHNTYLKELIDLQIRLTSNDDYRSICILIDDHKQLEEHRSLFLHYVYASLSSSVKKILEEDTIELTSMNLAFFNNFLCDITHMQRLRLIDTGRRTLLLPSCEIPLRTSNDINIVINRLSANMSFAHQILIINFSNKRSSLSGSFLFLQLAPICSLRSKGLLTNLNTTTYSVLNLIRQISNGQLFNHNREKRYLLNDYSLNRLLKNYLFSSRQIMTVIQIKPK